MVSENDIGSSSAQDLRPSARGASLQGEDIYRGIKGRGMTEEEVSFLLFQTIEEIIENLDEREKWEDFLRGFVDGTNPSYSHEGCEHSATHADPQCSPLFTCIARE